MIEFVNILDVIEKYPEKIEEIKEKYMELLSYLTTAPNVSTDIFLTQVKRISEYGKICIAYKNNTDQLHIIASGTLIIEHKLIHSAKSIGHIEDIVVHPNYRNKGISKVLLEKLKQTAFLSNCYKIILDCNINLKPVYEKVGFTQKSIQMVYYIDD